MKTSGPAPVGLKSRIRYDAILKDLFQRDHPLLLRYFTRGMRIRETLNVEFLAVDERRPDLVFLMDDDTLLHLEFQSANDAVMVYRMGRYCAMIAERYRHRIVRQIVLYTGLESIRMASSADLGLTKLAYELHDIREFDAADLLRSGRPGDCALALLASGGRENLGRILRLAAALRPPKRAKLLTQLTLLAGLRKLNDEFTMEMKAMGSVLYVKDHAFLREIYQDGLTKGRAEAKTEVILELMRAKFGSVPRWAQEKLRHAKPAQIERWTAKLLTAESVEAILGKPR